MRTGEAPEAGTGSAGFAASEAEASALLKSISAQAWIDRDLPQAQSLLGDVVVAGVRMFIVGRTGLGKTLLGMAMAFAMATGTDFLGWEAPKPLRVLYLDGEMPAERKRSLKTAYHPDRRSGILRST